MVPPAGCPRTPEDHARVRLLPVDEREEETVQMECRIIVILELF